MTLDAQAAPSAPALPIQTNHIRIQAAQGWRALGLHELWLYRELLYFLTWRDVKVRYKQAVLGATWAIIQPAMTMVVFSLVFGRLASMPSDGVPYPLFSYTALIPWTLFANGLTSSANSLVSSSNLLTKIYFPRLIIPVASLGAGLVDFALSFGLLFGLMAYYGFAPSLNVVFLPLFLLLAVTCSLAVGLWLSALNVQYRDVRYVVPFLTQFWLFITPVAYPATLIKNDLLRTLYGLNPMAGVVEGMRWALLGTGHSPGPMLWVSAGVTLCLLVSGAFYFRRLERTFADVV